MNGNGKTRVLLIEREDVSFEAHAGPELDVTVERMPALGLVRLGWEDYDMVVLDTETAGPSARQILVDFLKRNHLAFMFLIPERESGNGVPSLARTRPQEFAAKVQHLLA